MALTYASLFRRHQVREVMDLGDPCDFLEAGILKLSRNSDFIKRIQNKRNTYKKTADVSSCLTE